MRTITLYVSRRVRVPCLAAATVFDELCAAGTIHGPGAALALHTPVAPSGRDQALRRADGRLRRADGRLRRAGSRRSFPVEVELTAWSHLDAAVGVRPVGRRPPLADGAAQRRYTALALAVADHVAGEIEAAFAGWERAALMEAAGLLGAPSAT